MSTATEPRDLTEHADRVHAVAAVAVSTVVLLGLLVGAAMVASQVVDLMRWAAGG